MGCLECLRRFSQAMLIITNAVVAVSFSLFVFKSTRPRVNLYSNSFLCLAD